MPIDSLSQVIGRLPSLNTSFLEGFEPAHLLISRFIRELENSEHSDKKSSAKTLVPCLKISEIGVRSAMNTSKLECGSWERRPEK